MLAFIAIVVGLCWIVGGRFAQAVSQRLAARQRGGGSRSRSSPATPASAGEEGGGTSRGAVSPGTPADPDVTVAQEGTPGSSARAPAPEQSYAERREARKNRG